MVGVTYDRYVSVKVKIRPGLKKPRCAREGTWRVIPKTDAVYMDYGGHGLHHYTTGHDNIAMEWTLSRD